MSLSTNYITSGTSGPIDLSAVFPPYEMLYFLITLNGNYTANPIDYGFFPTYNNSNYIVIPTLYASITFDADNLSLQTFPLIVSKNSTGFLVTVRTIGTISLISSIYLVCLVVYFNPLTINNAFDINVNFTSNSNIDIGNVFPNYLYSQLSSQSTSNLTVNNQVNTFSGKGTNFSDGSGNSYSTFASYETATVGNAQTLTSVANQIIFPSASTGQREITVYNCSFVTTSTGSSIPYTVNTLAIYIPTPPTSFNIYNYNPPFNSTINATIRQFRNLFPRCVMYRQNINNNLQIIDINFVLTPTVIDPGSDYQVFVSYEYNNINGSSTVYSKFEASTAANNIIVSSKLTNQFTVTVTKDTNKIWDGSIVCLVIYGILN